MFVIASAVAAFLSSNAVVIPAVEVAEPNPKIMSQAEIRAFNARLSKGHKYYIQCRRGAPIGSFIKRQVSCRTNQQWARAEVRGNDEARDIGEAMKSKSWNTNIPSTDG